MIRTAGAVAVETAATDEGTSCMMEVFSAGDARATKVPSAKAAHVASAVLIDTVTRPVNRSLTVRAEFSRQVPS